MRILLIEDNEDDARMIRYALAQTGGAPFDVTWVDRLSTVLGRLAEGGFDAVLLDLSLPDGNGLDTFIRAKTMAPDVPIIVLTGLDDDAVAVKAVQQGAQDYLVKGHIEGNLLVRSIRYAIERHRLQARLRNSSLIDNLTGLYNRRGFIVQARQHLKLAGRTGRLLSLCFADLDHLKRINDTLGDHEGDRALIDIANIIKETFRESDIVARIYGDEFAILVVDAEKNRAEVSAARLQNNLDALNAQGTRPYKLSSTMGIVSYDPKHPCSVEELLSRANAAMHEEKRRKST